MKLTEKSTQKKTEKNAMSTTKQLITLTTNTNTLTLIEHQNK